ncbi:MAG: type IX secretion system sortase PorU [Bacteroidetes bacterium]|nr:type IX secretion system sortase PorU [Bacteroidota bacterium]
MKNNPIISLGRFLTPVLILFISVLLPALSYSQKSGIISPDTKSVKSAVIDSSDVEIVDFNVINSNESFIEIEFRPVYKTQTDFANSIGAVDLKGSPDVKFRAFPVFLTTSKGNNRVEIIDAAYTDEYNADIKPVPEYSYNSKSKEYVPVYNKDSKVYSTNTYFPDYPAAVNNAGSLRNKYLGYLKIYPVQFNPVTNSIKKYSYIRIRITYDGSPVYVNKSLSSEERQFLRGIALNSDAALNWSTKEFNAQKDLPVVNSVLASGDFYRMEVLESGIYKLDKNYLQNAGINVSGLDPRTIKIYGNGGSDLPYNNSDPAPVDLIENRIFVSGEDDGQFNDNDYILFYGRNPNEWKFDTFYNTYFHKINKFSKVNYYWISFGGQQGQRMQTVNSGNIQGISPLPSFKDKIFDEPEINNLGSTGYLWVSQRIGVNESFTFSKELKGYIPGSSLAMRFRFGNGSFFPTTWRLEDLNSGFIMNQFVSSINGFSHINLAYINNNILGVNYTLSPGKTSINFKASLRSQDGNSSSVSGYYDYYEVQYNRYLTAENNILRFNSPDTSGVMEYQINGFTDPDIKLLDVSNVTQPVIINPISYSNGVLRFQDNIIQSSPKEYYALNSANYKTPVSISSRFPNQNLKGEYADGASFIIIAPKEFMSAANRLKQYREQPGDNYIKTITVDIEEIYNEFSNGMVDPVAMRNFLKFAYNNWQLRPVYVMFMGDGSYDYKNIYNLYNANFKNWIPPIERNSQYSDDVESYCSDDYILEVTENYPEPSSINIVDFASGRLNANSLEDVNNYIDKIIQYENPANFDKWRNEVLYIADDGWTTENTQGQEGSLHTDQCEDVAQNNSPKYLKKNKIYIVSYPTEITPQGRRKPGANVDIIKNWNDGKLVINYTGHGSVDLWAHERIFERQVSIPQLTNIKKLPFITIASCDLARWDDPYILSAAEQLVVTKDIGAIGISAAVRPVYAVPNAIYNNLLYRNLFASDTLNLRLRLGKAVFNVKQQLYADNDLKFALLCDPTLRLGHPQHLAKIDSLNGSPASQLFEMKALQKIKIYGSIIRPDSSFWSDYNGVLDMDVLDVDKNISIIDFSSLFNFKLQGGKIFSGKVNVVNGKWVMEYVVPKDISYNPGNGKIISYFKNSTSDGIGYFDNFTISGQDPNAPVDTTGPEVKIYLDSRNFRSGDIVNQNPKLIVDFFDENGLNLTGTIGHKLEAILNDDENRKIDLTQYYTSTAGYQQGNVTYDFSNLAEGKYKLEVKAWDTYNNLQTETVEFNVIGTSELALENVYNYPNPFRDFTSFIFQHNSDSPLTAQIKIYTVSGRLIKELNKSNITDKFVDIEWDGKDTDGDIIANGTYLYKISINSNDGKLSKNSIGKLAKLK